MKKLLLINSSIFSSAGESSQLTKQFVVELQRNMPDIQITVRDLAKNSLPHLNAERIIAFSTESEMHTPEQQTLVEQSDALIEELKQAQIIVIGLPMYNLGIPSTLKSYFDHIARAGITFRYTENGSQGLLMGKKVYIFATRGGMYARTPLDTQTDYVRNFLGFIGIADVEFVYAEGLNLGEKTKIESLTKAHQLLISLAKTA